MKKKLGVTAAMEEGKFGQVDVFVGQELVASPGMLTKLAGIGANGIVEKVKAKLAGSS